MGSNSDWDTMQHAAQILQEFGVSFETRVVSAHRMPDDMFAYAEAAQGRGLRAIIAGAGGAAHLPGMLAAKTMVPVLGVPVASKHLQGVDSLHSIVQMPKGIPVATFAIGNAGAANAALMLATAGLAAAYGSQGIRVNAGNPGPTRTERLKEGLVVDARMQGIGIDDAMQRSVARIPLGRMAEPEEIARVVLFLASGAASYVTGICMTMDGAASPIVV